MSKAPPLSEQDWRMWGTPWRRLLARVQVTLWRGWTRCTRGFKAETRVVAQTPIDPAVKFPHPGNNDLFAYLKAGAEPDTGKNGSWYPDGYKNRAHTDVVEILRQLVDSDRIINGYAYGVPVIANQNGLIFAWVGGTHSVFIKLRSEHHDAARLDNGRLDPTYGSDWVEFRVGGLVGGPTDWSASMRRWAGVSYQDSLRKD